MSQKLLLQQRFAPFLKPLGFVYGKLMQCRRFAYKRGILKSSKPAVPTIAVGNIAWGGTGKTPVVNWLLAWAAQKKLRAVVLTRGYKAHPPNLPFLVQANSKPEEAGDEPLMLARKNPLAKIVVDPKRIRAAAYAEQHLQPELFVLDDGYQHLALRRDKNIVLLTANDLQAGWNQVLPAGTWREPKNALAAADVFLLRVDPIVDSGNPNNFGVNQCADSLALAKSKLPARPVFPFCFRNFALKSLLIPSQQVPNLAGRAYNLFCVVGSPQGVLHSAEELLGYSPREFFSFPDHYHYTIQDLERLCASGFDLVCTEKDAVKLAGLINSISSEAIGVGGATTGCPFWVLQLTVEFPPAANGQTFADWWEETFASL